LAHWRFVVLVVLFGVLGLSASASAQRVASSRLAVLPVASDTDTISGDALMTMYGLVLSRAQLAGETEVVDGLAYAGDLSEEKRELLGTCGEPTCARTLGAALRADEAVVTHIREFGRSRVMSMRIVDVRTGSILADHIETLRLPESRVDQDEQLLDFIAAATSSLFVGRESDVGLRPAYAELGVGRLPEPRKIGLPAGWHRHDGFFLRLGFGVGYFGMKAGGDDLVSIYGDEWRNPKSDAVGMDILFQIGGRVWDNLIVHADFDMAGVFDDIGESNSMVRGLAGAGLSYYWMPINVYASLSAGYAFLELGHEFRSGDQSSDRLTLVRAHGGGFSMAVGKEWWVSSNWGLGLAVRFGYSRVVGDGYECDLWRGGLQFSATYN